MMDRDVGNYLERYLNGILEYNSGISGEKFVPIKRLGELEYRYGSSKSENRLSERLSYEGIKLQSVKFDPDHNGFQLFTDILKSASDYFCSEYKLDLHISEDVDQTSLIFKNNGVKDVRILFDAYTNFLKKPEKYPMFFYSLLNECFEPFLELEKHELGISELNVDKIENLEDSLDRKSEIIFPLIEKQGLKIYGAYSEENDICLATDMFEDVAKQIRNELNVPVDIYAHGEEKHYITKLITDVKHADQIVNISDVYINLINPRR